MFMLCFSALVGALIVAAFSIGTGNLAMPLAASACALLAGAALAILGSREEIHDKAVSGKAVGGKAIGGKDTSRMKELNLDLLADTLSQQLRSISAQPVTASAPEGAVKVKRSA